MNKRIYRVEILIVLLILGALTIGCVKKNNNTVMNIQLTEREKTIASFSGDMFALLRFEFDNNIGGMALYLEEWKAGKKINSDLLSYGGTSEMNDLYITSNITVDDNSILQGTEWKIMTEHQGARISLGPYDFQFPYNKKARGYIASILGENQKKKIKLDTETDYVLAARCFDLSGNGISSTNCELMADEEELKEFDFVTLLRLVLYTTKEEEEMLH